MAFCRVNLKQFTKQFIGTSHSQYWSFITYYWQKIQKIIKNIWRKWSLVNTVRVQYWDDYQHKWTHHQWPLSIHCPLNNTYILKDKLFETVIHCSVAYFTMATEMQMMRKKINKWKYSDGLKRPEHPFDKQKYGCQ